MMVQKYNDLGEIGKTGGCMVAINKLTLAALTIFYYCYGAYTD
jgi:hypothetical protein